jgi:hypothetical protein
LYWFDFGVGDSVNFAYTCYSPDKKRQLPC